MPNNAEGLQGQGMCLALHQRGTVLGTSSTGDGDGSNFFQTIWMQQLRAATHCLAQARSLEGTGGQWFGPVQPEAMLPVGAIPRPPPGTNPAPGRALQAPGCCGQKHLLCQAQPSRENSPLNCCLLVVSPYPIPSVPRPLQLQDYARPLLAPSLASTVEPDSQDG